MIDQIKKVSVKAGIPLDDDKLEMVSGGMGGGGDYETCYWSGNGEHSWIQNQITGREYCEHCGIYK